MISNNIRKWLPATLLILAYPALPAYAISPNEQMKSAELAPKVKPKAKPKVLPKHLERTLEECITVSIGQELCRVVPPADASQTQRGNRKVLEPIMIRLPSDIAIGKFEVTQAEWRSIMGSNPAKFAECGDNCPVERVSWNDIQVYVQKLNQLTGKHYRLPTEAEWTAACLAGSNTNFCGSNNADMVAWYESNSEDRTHRGGQKTSNAWGLYDMSGNVFEWTKDCYQGNCSHQMIIRGGSWNFLETNLRAAYRLTVAPGYRSDALGFRLVQD